MSFDSLLKVVTVFCFWRVNQKQTPVKSPAKVEQGFLFFVLNLSSFQKIKPDFKRLKEQSKNTYAPKKR